MSTPNSKNHINNTTTNNTNNTNHTTTPVKGNSNINNSSSEPITNINSSSTTHHDVNTNINTSPSRGPNGGYNPNGGMMKQNNNYMGVPRSNYHNNNTRQPHHNNHHQQGPPPQQYYPYQQYPPQIYQGFQPGPPPYNQIYQVHPQSFVQGPPPGVIQPNFHPQGPSSPVPSHLQGPTVPVVVNPQSPNQPRHQQPITHQQPIINQPQPIIPQQQQQPPNQNRKPTNKSSVNSNNIPPRTHSAPPSSSDIQEHQGNNIQPNPPKFVPEKTVLNTSSSQFIPSIPIGNQYNLTTGTAGGSYKSPGIPQGPPHPHDQPIGPPNYGPGYSIPYYPHHQPPPPTHGPYYDHSYPPVYYQNQGTPNIHLPMNTSTPYIKENKPSSKLAIINPETMEQVNQSPPKSTPQQPAHPIPQFSLGNESIRNQKKEQKDTTTTIVEDKKSTEKVESFEKKDDIIKTNVEITTTITSKEVEEVKEVKVEDDQVKEESILSTTIVSSTESTPTKMETIKEDEISTKQTLDIQISQETLEKSNTNTSDDSLVDEIKKLSIDTSSNIEDGQVKEETDESSLDDSNGGTVPTSTSPPLRTTGDKITYSRDFMISLQPKSLEEPRNIKDLKSQMETSSGGLNRSGNKINTNQRGMNMSGNNFNQQQGQQNQQGMKMYPNQMQMKNYPQNKNYQNFAKNYQQQIHQGMQQQQQGTFQPQQGMQQQQQQPQFGYGITTFQQPAVQPPIASQVNENRWVPTEVNKLDDNQKLLRKAKFILNKITPEKFDILTDNLLELGIIDSEEIHKGTIQMIFDKALNESKFCTMYSDLCKRIFEYEKGKKSQERTTYFEGHKEDAVAYMGMNKVQQDKFEDEKNLKPVFRKLLLITCQSEYEKAHREFEKTDQLLPDNSTPEEKADFEEKQFIKRKLEFGLIKFIGELFNKDMLSEKILHGIFVNLLGELNKPVEIKLECFCKLLTITGKTLAKNEKASDYLSKYCGRMKELTQHATLSQRLKFLIQNVLDLKSNNWNPKSDEAPKPLKEFESQNRDDDRKSNTGVKTNVKNNFITNSIFSSTKFNTKTPQPQMPSFTVGKPSGAPMQPSMIMKKPPGLGINTSSPNTFNNNNYNKNVSTSSSNNSNSSNISTSSGGSGSSSPNNNGKRYQEQWDKIKDRIEEDISEYLELNDKSEFIGCIEDDLSKQSFLYPFVISTLLTSTFNLSESLFSLMMELVNEDKLFSVEDFKEGFNIFASSLPDLYEDRPGSYKNLASILYQCYNAKLLPLPLMASSLSKQVESIPTFISQILFEFILQFKNPKETASIFNEQKINISDFFSKKDKSSIIDSSNKYNNSLGVFFENLKDF